MNEMRKEKKTAPESQIIEKGSEMQFVVSPG